MYDKINGTSNDLGEVVDERTRKGPPPARSRCQAAEGSSGDRAAWEDGTLSSRQVAAVMANVAERNLVLFAVHEEEPVEALQELSAPETAAVMHRWRPRAEGLDDDPPPPERQSELDLVGHPRWHASPTWCSLVLATTISGTSRAGRSLLKKTPPSSSRAWGTWLASHALPRLVPA